jgi:hypothetical protein
MIGPSEVLGFFFCFACAWVDFVDPECVPDELPLFTEAELLPCEP